METKSLNLLNSLSEAGLTEADLSEFTKKILQQSTVHSRLQYGGLYRLAKKHNASPNWVTKTLRDLTNLVHPLHEDAAELIGIRGKHEPEIMKLTMEIYRLHQQEEKELNALYKAWGVDERK